MKKTLTALALTVVAGSMIACGGEATNTNNMNNANHSAPTNTAPMNTSTAPMANTNGGTGAMNSNSGAINTNGGAMNKNDMKKEEGKNDHKTENKKP